MCNLLSIDGDDNLSSGLCNLLSIDDDDDNLSSGLYLLMMMN